MDEFEQAKYYWNRDIGTFPFCTCEYLNLDKEKRVSVCGLKCAIHDPDEQYKTIGILVVELLKYSNSGVLEFDADAVPENENLVDIILFLRRELAQHYREESTSTGEGG